MKISGHNTLMLMAGIASMLMLSSCIKDKDLDGPRSASGDQAQVKFSIRLPGNASSTRALSETDENHVESITILVFGANGGDYKHSVRCSGSDITTEAGNPRRKTFTAKLRAGSCDLVLLANADGMVPSTGLFGKSKSQVLGALTASLPSGNGKWVADNSAPGYTGIPMWGELGNVTITEGSEITDADGLTLTRMVARVDVKVSGTAASNFVIKSVDLYNYNTAGTLVPASSGWNAAAGKATAPNVPASSTLTLGPLAYKNAEIDATNNRCQQEIYMFEAENHTDAGHAAAKANDDRTCLVVGGIYGSDTNPSYYRVDFSTGSGVSESFLDVLRNHHYTIDITEVAGSGYDTSADAFYGSVHLTATVTQWDLAAQNVTGDRQQRLNVSHAELSFRYTGGSATVTAQTDYDIATQGFPAGIQFDQAEIVYTPAGGNWLTLSGTTGAPTSAITATASENTGETVRTAKIFVRAGNFSKVVNVEQMPTINGAGTLPTGINTYVGAFWKAGQTGERVIKIDVGSTAGNLGAWSAYVYWTSGDWSTGDIVLAAGYGGSKSILYTASPGDAESYPVSGDAASVTGTVASGGSIVFRIGLKSTYTPSPGNPARYAVVALSYNNGAKRYKIFLRQGEGDDYLMRPGDPGTGVGGRTLAAKFSPYNLTSYVFKYGTSVTQTSIVGARGGSMTDYPTQAGAFFQWANTNGVIAYNPAKPDNTTPPSIWGGINTVTGYWGNTNLAYESCPNGYRRPTDGSATNTAAVAVSSIDASNSESGQSLYVNPASGYTSNMENSVWGYYADGFFDRRAIGQQTAYSGGEVNSAVATGISTVAYMGRMFYNPINNASLFFPAPGYRGSVNGYLYAPGSMGFYWTGSSTAAAAAINLSFQRASVARNALGRTLALTVRCVVE